MDDALNEAERAGRWSDCLEAACGCLWAYGDVQQGWSELLKQLTCTGWNGDGVLALRIPQEGWQIYLGGNGGRKLGALVSFTEQTLKQWDPEERLRFFSGFSSGEGTSEFGAGQEVAGGNEVDGSPDLETGAADIFSLLVEEEGAPMAVVFLNESASGAEVSTPWGRAFLRANLKAFATVHRRTRIDEQTGLLTRQAFTIELEAAWSQFARKRRPLRLALIDIDHFKRINDSFGHETGDAVLRELGGLLREGAPPGVLHGRMSGDEFLALCAGPDGHPGELLERHMENFRRKVEAHPFHYGEQRVHLTVSIGLAETSEWADSSPDDFLSRADLSLLRAKRLGRNRLCRFRDDSPEPVLAQAGVFRDGASRSPQARILVVDDNEDLAEMVVAVLSLHHKVDKAHTIEAAETLLRREGGRYDILVLDINFPSGSGTGLLHDLQDLPDPPLAIMITGMATAENAIHCLRHGAYDFIPKPFRLDQLLNTVGRAWELRRLRDENARYQNNLEDIVRERSAELTAALAETERSYRFTLEALVMLLSHRSDETMEHSRRVRRISGILGEALGLKGTDMEDLDKGALLHDIGKLAIPDTILEKPGQLDEEEWVIMRRHVDLGFAALRSNPYLASAARLVREHHERFDGSGYPQGLSGEAIVLGARIFAVADVYDALRSARPYKKPLSPEEAAGFIREQSGKLFDPVIVKVFEEKLQQIEQAGSW